MSKPVLKIAIKPKDSGPAVAPIAYWRNDNGRLNGKLDRSVKSITIETNDGEIIKIERDAQGRETHWINAYEDAPKPMNGGDDVPF